MPVPTADSYDRENQPTNPAGQISVDSSDTNTSGRRVGTGTGGTVTAPGYDASQSAESGGSMSREEADRRYAEQMEEEYAKREGGA